MILAVWLQMRLSKNQILALYLNRVYLGAGAYGVDAAAHRYFGKSAKRLTLYESALIAGLLKAPTLYNPIRDPERSAARTRQVLANMVAASFISEEEAAAAARQGAAVAANAASRPGSRYFADWIADQLPGFVGAEHGDLRVRTTFDPVLQREAERAIDALLARDGKRLRVGEGALLALSPDGAVKAMVGGRDYGKSEFNRATEAERPPGSAFKPFVYLAGLESGLAPGDHFFDGPLRIGNWRPRDYTHHYLGDVTMAEGLEQSINTVSVEVAEKAGLDHVIAVARRLGIDSRLSPHPSIALGTDGVNLLELTSAYAPFANGGYGVVPYGITEIRDGDGRVLYRRRGSGLGRVIGREYIAPMNEMLSAVVASGTGRRALLPRPAAGKTGTSEDYRDAWFIGYTAGLVAGVWFGNDNDAPMRGVTGGSLPAEAWRRFMLAAIRTLPPPRPLPGSPLVAAASPSPSGGLLGAFLRLFGSARAPAPAAQGRY
jgi:penicillin-binding protein 1A